MGNLCELNRYQIYREVKLHSSLQHENIITLFGAFQQGDQVRAPWHKGQAWCAHCTAGEVMKATF